MAGHTAKSTWVQLIMEMETPDQTDYSIAIFEQVMYIIIYIRALFHSHDFFLNINIKMVLYMFMFSGDSQTKKSPDMQEEAEALLRGMN